MHTEPLQFFQLLLGNFPQDGLGQLEMSERSSCHPQSTKPDLAQLSLTAQGMPLLLVGSQEENLRAAADKSAITRSRANVDGVHQHPNPPKIGNTIPAAGKQGEPDILDKALQVVNKELS